LPFPISAQHLAGIVYYISAWLRRREKRGVACGDDCDIGFRTKGKSEIDVLILWRGNSTQFLASLKAEEISQAESRIEIVSGKKGDVISDNCYISSIVNQNLFVQLFPFPNFKISM
jgi:hypothetical protein